MDARQQFKAADFVLYSVPNDTQILRGIIKMENDTISIEIYEKKTGKVVDTKQVQNLRAFSVYFSMQCDTKKYGWR